MTELAVAAANEDCAMRSLVYASLVAAFDYPDADMLDAIRNGDFADGLHRLLVSAGAELADEVDWAALGDTGRPDDDVLAEYTRLFIAGIDGPSCALEEGAHLRTQTDAMEETLRFYKYFGLSLPEGRQEQPDSLKTELEFLHYLTFQEAQSISEGSDTGGLRRAQLDFIRRHPGAWARILRDKLVASGAWPFFVELASVLERYLGAESRRLEQIVGPAAHDEPMLS